MADFYRNTEKTTDIWLTPPELVRALDNFNLDPASHHPMPWKLAENYYALELGHDGLALPWEGRVWLNPPYSNWAPFIKKLAEHGNGIALIFAKTETKAFHDFVFPKASALLFLKGRLKFCRPDGTKGQSATQPSVLVAYGQNNSESLRTSSLEGKYIKL